MRLVYGDDVFEEGIKKIAIDGALLIKELSKKYNKTNWRFEYSPESFTGTEVDFAAEVCNEVVNILKPCSDEKIIINSEDLSYVKRVD